MTDFSEKRIEDLQVGDVFDASGVSYAFGWRYHMVLTAPKKRASHPDEVHFECRVVGCGQQMQRNREHASWPLDVERGVVVRVYTGKNKEKLQNELVPENSDE